MWAITNLDKMNWFAKQPVVVSVFLATRLKKTTVEWLFYAWDDLHRETGQAWYLLVPTIKAIHKSAENIRGENFNSDLARSLIEQYQIPKRETPCIVFDDLNDEHHQHYISLKNMTEIERRDFFFACAKTINGHLGSQRKLAPGIWRQQVVADIYNYSQAKKYGRQLIAIAPMIRSVVKMVGAVHLPD